MLGKNRFNRIGYGRVGYGRGRVPNPTLPYSTQCPLLTPLLYPTLLGYVRLGKAERYDGAVLGNNRFNKDISLCYHEILLQFIQVYVYCTCIRRSKSTSILMCVCL